LGQARCFRNAGDLPEMRRLYAALAADTLAAVTAARAEWELAREYKSLGRFSECETFLNAYIRRFPYGYDYASSALLRGVLRLPCGRLKGAQEDFRLLLRRADRRADREAAAFWRGRAFLAAADTASAVQAMQSGLAYDIPDGYYGYRLRAM